MKLDNSIFTQTGIASLLIVFGVVIKNTFEQIGKPDHYIGKPLGMLLFTIGWIYMAYILSYKKDNKIVFIASSLCILASVIFMKQYMIKNKTPPMIFPLLFAFSWIIIGLMVGNHLSGNYKYIGLISSLSVLISMMFLLPHQRKNNIVDGAGLPLFVIGFFVLTIVNSNR
mgnify:CR=1 FL=1